MRRESNPEPSSESLAKKIVTKPKAVAVAKLPTEGSGFFDELSYERCMESLKKELQRLHPREEVIEKLLRTNRTKEIDGAPVHIMSLIEYPFLRSKNG